MSFRFGRITCALLLVVTAAFFSACQSVPNENPNFPMAKPPAQGDLYRLRVGDVIQVDVFQEPLMTTRQRIQGDGTISVSLLGRIHVAGQTIAETAAEIAALLDKKQIVKPQVTITVLAYAPRRFTVWGQVKTAGTFLIPPEETVSLPEAIAMAGGNTIIGNPRKAVISRKAHDGTIERLRVDSEALEAQTFLIEEGDVIFIPETAF